MISKRRRIVKVAIVVVIIGLAGKTHMDKQDAIRQSRELVAKEVQETVSQYVVENYIGVTEIKWHGLRINRDTRMGTTAMTMNGTENNFGGRFSFYTILPELSIEKIEKYMDARFKTYSFEGYIPDYMIEALTLQGVKKSKEGSPNAEIIYDWEENKLC